MREQQRGLIGQRVASSDLHRTQRGRGSRHAGEKLLSRPVTIGISSLACSGQADVRLRRVGRR